MMSVQHSFELFDLEGKYDVALGMDILPKISIQLVNVPTEFPQVNNDLTPDWCGEQ
jgi:hypothetical protein